MNRIFVKPAQAGLVVRFPYMFNRVLKQDGEYVNDHREWRKLFLEGDIFIIDKKQEEVNLEKPTVKPKEKLNKQGDK